jgi:hypothetical protein
MFHLASNRDAGDWHEAKLTVGKVWEEPNRGRKTVYFD